MKTDEFGERGRGRGRGRGGRGCGGGEYRGRGGGEGFSRGRGGVRGRGRANFAEYEENKNCETFGEFTAKNFAFNKDGDKRPTDRTDRRGRGGRGGTFNDGDGEWTEVKEKNASDAVRKYYKDKKATDKAFGNDKKP